ncbi:MAG: hypothetical protein Q9194_007549 [Teloschistes cf. exilis]
MAFTSEFALALELASFFPPIKWAVTTAGDAIMSYARELRQSGSDIVAEEDLANVFGRCKISSRLASSFKTVVAQSTSNVSLLEGIMLQGGPGPIVARAFKDSAYFSMVVQLSLLTWAFDRRQLAAGIADALHNRLRDAPSQTMVPSTPDILGILGVLRVCASQTAAFDWNMILDAVSVTQGYEDLPVKVLQGLLDMLPMVQTLPGDRMIHIEIPVGKDISSGTSALVIWAHHALGLTVLVRLHGERGRSEKYERFGSAAVDQLSVEEVEADGVASITLLDTQQDSLLNLTSEPDGEDGLISSVRKIPARGYGNGPLKSHITRFFPGNTQTHAILQDLQNVTSAFAIIVARGLDKVSTVADINANLDDPRARKGMKYYVNEDPLLQTSKFLFDNAHLSHQDIDTLVAL